MSGNSKERMSMESNRKGCMDMESTIMEDKTHNQQLSFQGKNQQAGEHWFNLITQIALDYRRLKDSTENNVQNNDEKTSSVLGEVHQAVAV